MTTKGNRSRFIDRAVKQFVVAGGKANLRARLKEEAIATADRDLGMAIEWFPLEEEAAQGAEVGYPKKSVRKRA